MKRFILAVLICLIVPLFASAGMVIKTVGGAPAANYAMGMVENDSTEIAFTGAAGINCVYWRMDSTTVTPVSTRNLGPSFISSFTELAFIRISSGTITVIDGSGSCEISDSLSNATEYHGLMCYDPDGTYSLEMNTSGTFSGDGTDHCDGTDGSQTSTPNKVGIRIGSDFGSDPTGIVFDVLKYNDASIGSNGSCSGSCEIEESYNSDQDCYSGDTTYNNCAHTWTVQGGSPDFQATSLD